MRESTLATHALAEAQLLGLGRVPQDAPDVVVQNSFRLKDASKVLSWAKEDRQRSFNVLVRR